MTTTIACLSLVVCASAGKPAEFSHAQREQELMVLGKGLSRCKPATTASEYVCHEQKTLMLEGDDYLSTSDPAYAC